MAKSKQRLRIPLLPNGLRLQGQDGKPVKVLYQVAKGGLGSIYMAEREGTNCVVKVPKYLRNCSDLMIEIAWQKEPAPPGITPYLAYGVFPGKILLDSLDGIDIPFAVMPYYEETLDEEISAKATQTSEQTNRDEDLFPPSIIARRIVTICRALRRLRVVHRDIKPANIFISWSKRPFEDNVVIADFGLAIPESHEERQRLGFQVDGPCGTPDYMSLEQFVGDANIDQRSDIYALALIMYEMATGQPYRKFSSGKQPLSDIFSRLIENERRCQALPPSSIVDAHERGFTVNPSLVKDQRLRDIIAIAGAANPKNRYQRHSELIADLMNIIIQDEGDQFFDDEEFHKFVQEEAIQNEA